MLIVCSSDVAAVASDEIYYDQGKSSANHLVGELNFMECDFIGRVSKNALSNSNMQF